MKKIFLAFLFISFLCVLNAHEVKVLLAQNAQNSVIKASGPFRITNLQNNKKYKTKKGGSFKVSAARVGSIEDIPEAEVALISAEDFFTFSGNKYRGPLLISTEDGAVNIIERVDLEEYLEGVLPYEMSPSWPVEALKAQAVAARTYTLKTLQRKADAPFDLFSDTRSQVYKGSVIDFKNVKKAVEETKGQVLKYKGELFYTYYHSNCGGGTDNFPWMHTDIKPLRGVRCGYCSEGTNGQWSLTLSESTINKFLASKKINGEIEKIKIGKKLSSGRADTLLFITSKGKKELPCNDFRTYVGAEKFKSCKITDISKFKFEGRGFGHGAGLCQEGAKAMAQDGKSYKKILSRYFPSSDLEKF